MNHSTAAGPDAGLVSVLHWPAEEELRRQHAWFGLPRVLLVHPDQAPPELLDPLEDWMRDPADPADLRARCAALQRRAVAPRACEPRLDDDGLLWVGTAWVALTHAQALVGRLLVDNLDRVVRYEAVVTACEGGGRSGHAASVRTLLSRLGVRVSSVGLNLVSVRRRGVLLTTSLPIGRAVSAGVTP